jgi:hypothetical protein
VGRDIVLAAGQYNPDTVEGRGLLAHELTHVVQQGASVNYGALPSKINASSAAREQHRDRGAAQVLSASCFGMTPAKSHLQRYAHADCSDSDLRTHVWPADGIAKQMVAKAIRVLTAKPADPAVIPLLSKYFMSSTPDVAGILAVYNQIQSDFTGNAYTYECEEDCDAEEYGYVRHRLRYIGVSPNIHLCMNVLRGRANDCIARTIVHEFGHYSAHADDEAYCKSGCSYASCPSSLSQDDALDNADSYACFAYELFPLSI